MIWSGKDRGKMKSVLKTRKVDLKLGKKGLTAIFLEESKKVISVDKMIKVSLDSDKRKRKEQTQVFAKTLGLSHISTVGRIASFGLNDELLNQANLNGETSP